MKGKNSTTSKTKTSTSSTVHRSATTGKFVGSKSKGAAKQATTTKPRKGYGSMAGTFKVGRDFERSPYDD